MYLVFLLFRSHRTQVHRSSMTSTANTRSVHRITIAYVENYSTTTISNSGNNNVWSRTASGKRTPSAACPQPHLGICRPRLHSDHGRNACKNSNYIERENRTKIALVPAELKHALLGTRSRRHLQTSGRSFSYIRALCLCKDRCG